MPRYDFYCADCQRESEVTRAFDDEKEILCESCLVPLRRKYSAPPVHFRGSGFYSTDK
jgi:putative FmdB family regulatory protein